MARSHNLGKSIVLLLLIIILVLGGLLWFDYLGFIKAKKFFSPVYRLFGLEPQSSQSVAKLSDGVPNLDDDRFAKRLEALDIRTQELDKREGDIVRAETQNEEVARELDERRRSQDEREQSFLAAQKQYNDREENIKKNASNLAAMPPATAVAQLLEMDDQDIIDILRMEDELAASARTTSMTSVWLMNMPADRAATVQRKMANKPESID